LFPRHGTLLRRRPSVHSVPHASSSCWRGRAVVAAGRGARVAGAALSRAAAVTSLAGEGPGGQRRAAQLSCAVSHLLSISKRGVGYDNDAPCMRPCASDQWDADWSESVGTVHIDVPLSSPTRISVRVGYLVKAAPVSSRVLRSLRIQDHPPPPLATSPAPLTMAAVCGAPERSWIRVSCETPFSPGVIS